MENRLQAIGSNRLEALCECLQGRLKGDPFVRRLVVVSDVAMSRWLEKKMTQEGYVNAYFLTYEDLLSRLIVPSGILFDSEALMIRIESSLRKLENDKQELKAPSPLFRFFQNLSPLEFDKRLALLAEKLSLLFDRCQKQGKECLEQEERWQVFLWKEALAHKESLSKRDLFPFDFVKGELHLFALSFLSDRENAFFAHLAKAIPVYSYFLSPCYVFWGDILSDKESQRLQHFWEKKKAPFLQREALRKLLSQRNPLLANWGKIAKERMNQIEASDALVSTYYRLPASLLIDPLYADYCIWGEASWETQEQPFTLLQALQADIATLRSPEENNPRRLEEKESIQFHIVPSRKREIQALYHVLLGILEKSSFPLEEVTVFAPEIQDYVPFIEAIFGGEESVLPYRIEDKPVVSFDSFSQTCLRLLSLPFSAWDASSFLRFLQEPSFYGTVFWTKETIAQMQEELEKAETDWKKQEFFSSKETWEESASRLLVRWNVPSLSPAIKEGKLILKRLFDDFLPLRKGKTLPPSKWAHYVKILWEKYFSFSSEAAPLFWERFSTFLCAPLIQMKEEVGFLTFKKAFERFLKKFPLEPVSSGMRFASLAAPRTLYPSAVVVLLGMEEGKFPRESREPSGGYALKERLSFIPSQKDWDRDAFLQATLAARSHLLFFYRETMEIVSSPLISELMAYLDKGYVIEGKKASETLTRRHPLFCFDPRYFSPGSEIKSYSLTDYRAAAVYSREEKKRAAPFFSSFERTESAVFSQKRIDLKDLVSLARNPLKIYFNSALGMELNDEGLGQEKETEEFLLPPIEAAILKREALKKPLEEALQEADQKGKLSFGVFKSMLISQIRQETEETEAFLRSLNVSAEEVFEMQLTEEAKGAERTEKNIWRFPPLEVIGPKGEKVKIVGRLREASPEGLIVRLKDEKNEALKVWPEFLVFCAAIQHWRLPLKPRLLFVKSASVKEPFFADPFPLLFQYLEYYGHSLTNVSPFLPEWTFSLLDFSCEKFQETMRSSVDSAYKHVYNDYLKWVFRRGAPAAPDETSVWRQVGKSLFEPLATLWYGKNEKI